MKFLFFISFALLVGSTLSIELKSVDHKDHHQKREDDPRIWGWITDWIINPIVDGFSWLLETIGSVIDAIISTTLYVFDSVWSFFFVTEQGRDPCKEDCFQRILNPDGSYTDYHFNNQNGCISKGFTDPSTFIFNQCCDLHNSCLNSRCCTNNCQGMKNECDSQYSDCLAKVCENDKNNEPAYLTCMAKAGHLAQMASDRTCNSALTTNRKICYC